MAVFSDSCATVGVILQCDWVKFGNLTENTRWSLSAHRSLYSSERNRFHYWKVISIVACNWRVSRVFSRSLFRSPTISWNYFTSFRLFPISNVKYAFLISSQNDVTRFITFLWNKWNLEFRRSCFNTKCVSKIRSSLCLRSIKSVFHRYIFWGGGGGSWFLPSIGDSWIAEMLSTLKIKPQLNISGIKYSIIDILSSYWNSWKTWVFYGHRHLFTVLPMKIRFGVIQCSQEV